MSRQTMSGRAIILALFGILLHALEQNKKKNKKKHGDIAHDI